MNTNTSVSTVTAHTASAAQYPGQPWQKSISQGRLLTHMHVNGTEMDVEANGTDGGEGGIKLRAQREQCLVWFQGWNQTQQTEFAEQLIARMSFHQHEHLYAILLPMLQRDFITALPGMCMCVRVRGCAWCMWERMCMVYVRAIVCGGGGDGVWR